MSFHDKTAKEVLTELKTSEKGLYSTDAKVRLETYGPNALPDKGRASVFKLILSQFASPIVWVLIVAMVISIAVDELTDGIVIAVILVLNAILGFIQEYRAENAIAALKKLTALKAKVLRDGKEQLIAAADLVPGDIILLETGDKVPADCRLIDVTNLQTQEAALTGESTPVTKQVNPVKSAAQVADRINLVYSGTIVTAGRAKAVVAGTGKDTEIGKIATLIQEAETERTPLQKQLARLSVALTILVVVIALVVFTTGVIQNQPLFTFFLAAVALAVAAIPEGLPAIVTMSLAIGVQRMAARNALIRKLPSAETLGSCTVICSDKTGTLTHNQMTVRKVYVDGQSIEVTGSGYAPEGKFAEHPKDLDLLLTIGALNNDSKVEKNDHDWAVFGDPTEAALLVSARKGGVNLAKLTATMQRVGEIEFTSERKRMTTLHEKAKKVTAFVKGAPDVIVEHCTKIIENGKVRKLTPDDKKAILAANEAFANDALRVLGFAYRDAGKERTAKVEKELIFVGLQAMIDPPRIEVREAIAECVTAGIKVVMITGDHLSTAQAIAKELGITGKAITGADLETLQDFENQVNEIGIYARVNPEHKIRIVDALQKLGHVAAMTGDGVNDAPALKKADIGIAMGITGTDVAKEASAMVLADDNFATIVAAVREGRRIFDNISKFVRYMLSSNTGEVLTVFLSILLGLPLPVIAIQLLWINLITDGLPALALGVEPASKDVMQRPPRKQSEHIITKGHAVELVLIGLTITAGTLYLFTSYAETDLMLARTMAFTTLVLGQMFNVINKRSDSSVFTYSPFSNPWVLLAIASSIGLQLLVLYSPLNTIFEAVPLQAEHWYLIIPVAAGTLVMGEIVKLLRKAFNF